MSDVFGRATDAYGGSFSADGATVTFSVDPSNPTPAGALTGLLIQQMSTNYEQNILHLYEIGSPYHYLIAGRSQGQMAMARVLGPRPVSLAFYAKFGNVCNAATNNIILTFLANCGPPVVGQPRGAAYQLAVLFSVIRGLGTSMNAENALISENLNLMFCSLLLAQL